MVSALIATRVVARIKFWEEENVLYEYDYSVDGDNLEICTYIKTLDYSSWDDFERALNEREDDSFLYQCIFIANANVEGKANLCYDSSAYWNSSAGDGEVGTSFLLYRY